MMQGKISSSLSWDWTQMQPPGFFVWQCFTMAQHEHVMDFSGCDSLLSSWIICNFFNIVLYVYAVLCL